MLTKNALKTKLMDGELCLAAALPFPSPPLAEILARCGSDAIIFDSEHGSLDISQIEELVRSCEVVGVTPLCSIPAARPEIILRTLDAGVMGIIVPHVMTREDAESIVSCVKYSPVGHRSIAMMVRATGYLGMSMEDYIEKANTETMVIIKIEDPEGVDNIQSILKTDGLDCVFIGRSDLALSMGHPGRVDVPEVHEAVEKIASMTLDAGLTLMVATDEREAPYWIKRGAKLLSIHVVPFIRRRWTGVLGEIRRHKEE